jgi:hypothetical protein
MSIDLFNRWFTEPINILKKLPNGDGGFAAFMISIPLYERYIISKLKLENKLTDDKNIRNEIANDLNLTDGQRTVFWDMFRNGLMHEAMPKDGKTLWITSSKFTELPEFKTISGHDYVCIDPWKFADRVLSKFTSDHRLITASESFPFASIFALPK